MIFTFFKSSFRSKNIIIRRYAKKIKTKDKMKPTSIDHALKHFDEFYSAIYKTKWPSIRLALQCPSKYCAIVNTFSDIDNTVKMLEECGTINLNTIYNQIVIKSKNYKEESKGIDNDFVINNLEHTDSENKLEKNDRCVYSSEISHIVEGEYVPATKLKYEEEVIDENEYFSFLKSDTSLTVNSEIENNITFPVNWNIFTYPRGSLNNFPAPKKDSLGLFSYYLMDGASILPVLALNPQPGEYIGDFCAAPGGKTLAILFSFQFGKLLCNEISKSRINRLLSVLNQYIPSINVLDKRLEISNLDAREIKCNTFDKVLLDVPCTNDRISVNEIENNIFSSNRTVERIRLPQLQMDILSTGLKSLKINGSAVYSTCSLSPIQNDGVVHMALSHLWENMRMEFIIKDLTDSFKPLHKVMKFWNCKYGKLVIPFLPLNYGPMYICKITRIK